VRERENLCWWEGWWVGGCMRVLCEGGVDWGEWVGGWMGGWVRLYDCMCMSSYSRSMYPHAPIYICVYRPSYNTRLPAPPSRPPTPPSPLVQPPTPTTPSSLLQDASLSTGWAYLRDKNVADILVRCFSWFFFIQ